MGACCYEPQKDDNTTMKTDNITRHVKEDETNFTNINSDNNYNLRSKRKSKKALFEEEEEKSPEKPDILEKFEKFVKAEKEENEKKKEKLTEKKDKPSNIIQKKDKSQTKSSDDQITFKRTIDYKKLNQMELKKHNEFRALHHVGPLKLNSELIDMAQKYAKYLAKNKQLEHSINRKMSSNPDALIGENLYFSSNSAGPSYTTGTMSQSWYDEIENYNFSSGTSINSKVISHFTQVVWNDTKEVGFGIAFNGNDCYAVANYYPAGNFNRGELDNVFPLSLNISQKMSSKLAKDSFDLEKARKNELAAINALRKRHQACQLKMSDILNEIGQEHATMMSKTHCLQPVTGFKYKNKDVSSFYWNKDFKNGESYKGGDITKDCTRQRSKYDFDTGNGNYEEYYQFAHLIWQTFNEIGIGYAFDSTGKSLYAILIFDGPLYYNLSKQNMKPDY